MHDVMDIANWFIFYNNSKDVDGGDEVSNLKLQKLLYYAQSAFLTMKEKALFNASIRAWEHGPVVPEVYAKYKEYGSTGIVEFDPEKLKNIDEETEALLISVYNIFGEYSAWGLRNLTHSEEPWATTEQNEVIQHKKMKKTFREKYIER